MKLVKTKTKDASRVLRFLADKSASIPSKKDFISIIEKSSSAILINSKTKKIIGFYLAYKTSDLNVIAYFYTPKNRMDKLSYRIYKTFIYNYFNPIKPIHIYSKNINAFKNHCKMIDINLYEFFPQGL